MLTGPGHPSQISVRAAQEADVAALAGIKAPGTEALHRDRLKDAREPGFQYLVLQVDQTVIGFACLVFQRPAHWPDADDKQRLPQIVDLMIHESYRGLGFGSIFMREIERIAAAAGYQELYLSVEPRNNPLALALYQRLGYRQLQTETYHSTWEFKDTHGKLRSDELWLVDMVKSLTD